MVFHLRPDESQHCLRFANKEDLRRLSLCDCFEFAFSFVRRTVDKDHFLFFSRWSCSPEVLVGYSTILHRFWFFTFAQRTIRFNSQSVNSHEKEKFPEHQSVALDLLHSTQPIAAIAISNMINEKALLRTCCAYSVQGQQGRIKGARCALLALRFRIWLMKRLCSARVALALCKGNKLSIIFLYFPQELSLQAMKSFLSVEEFRR